MYSHVHVHKLRNGASNDLQAPLHPAPVLKPSHSTPRGNWSCRLFWFQGGTLDCSAPSSPDSPLTPLSQNWSARGLVLDPFLAPSHTLHKQMHPLPLVHQLPNARLQLPDAAQTPGPHVELPLTRLPLDARKAPQVQLVQNRQDPPSPPALTLIFLQSSPSQRMIPPLASQARYLTTILETRFPLSFFPPSLLYPIRRQ